MFQRVFFGFLSRYNILFFSLSAAAQFLSHKRCWKGQQTPHVLGLNAGRVDWNQCFLFSSGVTSDSELGASQYIHDFLLFFFPEQLGLQCLAQGVCCQSDVIQFCVCHTVTVSHQSDKDLTHVKETLLGAADKNASLFHTFFFWTEISLVQLYFVLLMGKQVTPHKSANTFFSHFSTAVNFHTNNRTSYDCWRMLHTHSWLTCRKVLLSNHHALQFDFGCCRH